MFAEKAKKFVDFLFAQKTAILVSVFIGAAVSMVSFQLAERRYKVTAVISIPPQYFQIPLVRDFLPETMMGPELNAQREALIRQSLNLDFIKRLTQKYLLLGKTHSADPTDSDLKWLSKRFEIVPVGPGSYLIGFFYSDPQVGYKVVREIMERIHGVMTEKRQATLSNIRSSLLSRLQSLSLGPVRAGSHSGVLASRPDLVEREIERLRDEEKLLRKSYSEEHPKVAALKGKIRSLSKLLDTASETDADGWRGLGTISGENVDPSSKELFQDLLRKFHYMEVVIDLDRKDDQNHFVVLDEPFVPMSAVWPKRPLFLIWGVAFGFLIGTVVALLKTSADSTWNKYKSWFSLRLWRTKASATHLR